MFVNSKKEDLNRNGKSPHYLKAKNNSKNTPRNRSTTLILGLQRSK